MSKFILLSFFFLSMAKNLIAEDILVLSINLEKDKFLPLTKDLEVIFKMKVKLERYDLDLSSFYNQKRKQFNSSAILNRLKNLYLHKKDIILGILDEDLYVEGLNFVFGEASPENRIAIISVKRLKQEFYGLPEDRDLFLKRTLKEAVHEIGHIFGLSHCLNPKCVMHFSNSLLDTDIKDFRFCSLCEKGLGH